MITRQLISVSFNFDSWLRISPFTNNQLLETPSLSLTVFNLCALKTNMMFFGKGNQICSHCHKLEEEFDAHNQEKNAMAAKGQKREAVLNQTYPTINRVRVNDLEQVIENLRQEKRDVESRLLREKNKLVGDLQDCQRHLAKAQRKNSTLTTQNGHLEEQNKKLKKKNSGLLLKIKTGECETSECDERKAERNRRPSSEIELLRKKNESLIKENKDSIQKIKDLEENMNELKTTNKILSSKSRTEECETRECDKLKAELNLLSSERERLRKEVANANADSLQKIEKLKTKIKVLQAENNSLQSKTRETKCEINKIAKANADFLQKTEALERNNKRLQTKMETKESEKCKMLEEEVNKYKNAVCRKY